jgi:Fe-S-cluster containining protein
MTNSLDIFKGSETKHRQQPLYAGQFSLWLHRTRRMLAMGNGAKVPCGKCKGCCTSSYFIPIGPEETRTLKRIPKKLLFAAPFLPQGNMVLGYDEKGHCPMLIEGKCSIYDYRPLTCRNYDCRIFHAAGIAADDDGKSPINNQVVRWKFSYLTKNDRIQHSAIKAAAKFISENAVFFPNGKVPDKALQLAILAIKVYELFLKRNYKSSEPMGIESGRKIAKAIMEASVGKI